MHSLRHRRGWKKLLVLGVLATLGLPPAAARSAVPRALNSPITVRWQGVTIRQAGDRLGESQRLCVWLDRRVDPSSEVELSAQDTPLSAVLDTLAEQAGAAWVAQDTLIYVAPAENVRELRTLLALAREDAEALPAATRARMHGKVALDIPRLAQPRLLMEQLATRGGVRVENLDVVPHDVWPAAQLPAMSVAEQLTVVLAGFDLQWKPADDGRAITIQTIERPVVVRQLYDRTVLDGSAAAELDRDAITAGPNNKKVWIAATIEQHEALGGAKPAAAPARPRSRRGQKHVYSLRVQQQPIGPMLEQLARQLGKRLDVDAQVSRDKLNQRVSFEVKQADLDELLEAACEPAGLTAEVEGETIRLQLAPGE